MSAAVLRPSRIDLSRANVLLLGATLQGLDIVSQVFSAFGSRMPLRATDPTTGLRIVEEQTLDLIVCDAALGEIDGYDFVHHLRRSKIGPNAYAPVMLISAHTRASQVCKARDCGPTSSWPSRSARG